MTRAHDARILDRLREIPALSEAVFDGDVTGRPQRYVLVHTNRGVARPDRLTGGAPTRSRQTVWVHSVGVSKTQADAVAERVIGKLRGWRPDVAGYSCEPLTHEASEPVQKDDTRQPALYYGVDQFDYWTTPSDVPVPA